MSPTLALSISWLAVLGASAEPSADAVVDAGPFVKIYDPSVGEAEPWYINDHCFVRGTEGKWHLFGITRQEPASPLDEDNLAHATADSLLQQPWVKMPFALSVAEEPWKETHLWAPHVVFHDGQYYMFYCAGGADHTRYKIHLAVSNDLTNWERHADNPMAEDGFDARDPFVTRIGDRWLMYYTATSKPDGGNHVVACVSSTNLTHWSDRKVVFVDPASGTYGGPTESPVVVRRGDTFYLFIGPRGGYDGTDVFRSKDPFHWRVDDKVGHIEAHAAEVVRDVDGKWYVSRCGWGRGGVYLAPLTWNDGLDEAESNVPVPAGESPDTAMALYRKAQQLMKQQQYNEGYATAQQAMSLFAKENNRLAWMMLESIELEKVRVTVHFNMGPRERKPPEIGIIRPVSFRVWSKEPDARVLEVLDFEIGYFGGRPGTAALGMTMGGAHANFGVMPTDTEYKEIRARALELIKDRHQ
ncbi:MAG: hypothetical protein FJ276_24485 [Planctomycetes bacterium]|nr:hypothetical protein [Planctomycetota bacterium]